MLTVKYFTPPHRDVKTVLNSISPLTSYRFAVGLVLVLVLVKV